MGSWVPWDKDTFDGQPGSSSLLTVMWRAKGGSGRAYALNPRVVPWRLLSTQHLASDLCIPLGPCPSPHLLLFPLLPSPPPLSLFPFLSSPQELSQ